MRKRISSVVGSRKSRAEIKELRMCGDVSLMTLINIK